MAFYTGRTGALFLIPDGASSVNPLPTQQAVKLRDWSLETSLELLETTTVDTAVKSYTPGAVSATGSATLLYYRKEPGEVGIQFTGLLSKIMKTAAAGVGEIDRVGMVLRVGKQAGTASDIKDDIAFNAYITNASIQVNTGELTSIGIQFTVDGPFRELVDA